MRDPADRDFTYVQASEPQKKLVGPTRAFSFDEDAAAQGIRDNEGRGSGVDPGNQVPRAAG